ncbi:MAG TPA: polyphenol oxidase family protein [Candidatus Dormibacteraeota bacterium]|nr:polyphenol oxidase family protein [Candidatus Dormibacteraeota bacterium]
MARRKLIHTPQLLKIHELDDPAFVHGFSTMALGSVGLTHAPDPVPVLASRRAFARALGIDEEPVTTVAAVHGSSVARVDEPVEVVQGVDGLVTDRRGVTLFATFADCYPIVLWDPNKRCAGLAHAGWRGTAAGVAKAAVKAMHDEYGSAPGDIRAGIGPGICGRCYEVGGEVASQFEPRFVTPGAGDRFLLDLAAANKAQLEEAGLSDIHVLGLCTKETDFLPSHRRTPDGTRFGAIVALR